MKSDVEAAIKTLTEKCVSGNKKPLERMQLAQAVLSLTQAVNTLAHVPADGSLVINDRMYKADPEVIKVYSRLVLDNQKLRQRLNDQSGYR
jgi:hypothetical protein